MPSDDTGAAEGVIVCEALGDALPVALAAALDEGVAADVAVFWATLPQAALTTANAITAAARNPTVSQRGRV